jgi:hypothetical protein
VAKLDAFPASAAQAALETWRLDPHEDEDGFRHAATDFFRENEVDYELRAQLWNNAHTQPIEDASVEWSTSKMPTIHKAALPFPGRVRNRRSRSRLHAVVTVKE